VDLFLFDFKHIDGDAHRRGVGVDNDRILANLATLASRHEHVWVRIPVVPGFNTDPDVFAAMAEFLSGLERLEQVELLPFHRLGEGKYRSLGREYTAADVSPPGDEEMQRYRRPFVEHGLPVK
jgi:pyruvate formate lyase activating enzyme